MNLKTCQKLSIEAVLIWLITGGIDSILKKNKK